MILAVSVLAAILTGHTAPASARVAPAPPAHQLAPAPAAHQLARPHVVRSPRSYVVRTGDTLIGICTWHSVSLDRVLMMNRLTRDSIIHPGRRLLLPAPPAAPQPNSTFLGRTYPPAVVAAANTNRRILARRSVLTRAQVRRVIITTSRRFGTDPALALAVAYQESGFNQRMVSPANAVGVMQVIPASGRWASTLSGRRLDLLDTRDNITAGVVVLAAVSEAADSESLAVAGYYQGSASVRRNGMFDDTRRYVAAVQALKSRFARTL
jgi:soluble lytic murein transglycosylase-like protein